MTFVPSPRTLRGTLYDPRTEHDACGTGLVTDINGRRTHEIVAMAIEALANLEHRGGVAADAGTGDGAGILAQVPVGFFGHLLGLDQIKHGDLAAGMFFVDRHLLPDAWQPLVERELRLVGLEALVWRRVPTRLEALGSVAAETRPSIWQVFINRPEFLDRGDAFEKVLYLARRGIESGAAAEQIDLYSPSLSSRTIVYKGLMLGSQLANFYPDLADPEFRSAIAIYHQRYATNTFPNWKRAQPFRLLAHNGEINTLDGNVNWMKARELAMRDSAWGAAISPIIDNDGSDSAMLDNAVEALARSGRELRHVLMMLVPEAWERIPGLPEDRRAFYRYHACLSEPWDGPAALIFSDGRVAGATLDRNGLRPSRYLHTKDGLVIAGSETGVIDIPARQVIRRGKLGPGQMLLIDTRRGRLLLNDEVKAEVCAAKPYNQWIHTHLHHLDRVAAAFKRANGDSMDFDSDAGEPVYEEGMLVDPPNEDELPAKLLPLQQLFGYTAESIAIVLKPMATSGKEPVGSMGDDTPQAVLSRLPRPLFHYFRQRFAEVTNPPIDPLREHMVMSLTTLVGRRHSILDETPEHARLLELDSPVLDRKTFATLRRLRRSASAPFDPRHDGLPFSLVELDMTYPLKDDVTRLEAALDRLCQQAAEALANGHNLLLLSDRAAGRERLPVPSLLAVGAVHHYLIRRGLRMQGSILVEAGDANDVHCIAALVGYGASAVHPWLAINSVRDLASDGRLKGVTDADQVEKNYVKALEAGLLKIMSKMGIATVDSYCGAQIFEIIGLNDDVVGRCFTGTSSRLGGVGFVKLANDLLYRHDQAYNTPADKLEHWGFFKYRKAGEHHALNPDVIDILHEAVRHPGAMNGQFDAAYGIYKRYSDLVTGQPATDLRDLMAFKPGRTPIPLTEVEPVEAILPRFSTAAMSMGALSEEAHEVLALAMNRIGGRSNSGEGGEDPARLGGERNSGIKQVASGRFGVTPAYLVSADELQIKMAQGSKPGEGGHLPGQKVSEKIAYIRLTTPGVALISPPPHHDIYSIEDLAQLIFDLRQVNPQADISVKLVAETGVGTVAAGVAKGRANSVLISGHAGGTGASPLSSIKHAGIPWEIGLAETQQILRANNLRDRIIVRADGGLRNGRDVLMAAILGADEYSFGTLAMIAEGCILARVCHNNTCPVGVATQDPKLRAKFAGNVDHVVAVFTFIAQEVRELLAELGFRKLDEVIGHTELLEQRVTGDNALDSLDLSPLLAQPDVPTPYHHQGRRDYDEPAALGNRLAETVMAALKAGERVVRSEMSIRNTDRTVGARLSGRLAQAGLTALAPNAIDITFHGSAGQSFGAFLPTGVRFRLFGDANDYVGKGLAGGVLVARPPADAAFVWAENYLIGNTVLYGATGGVLYAAGRAGERFAVRNSRANAVVEGVGDHGCEYMTGGAVVVLGRTGNNFAAGMTGGQAFVLDTGTLDDPVFPDRLNHELVFLSRVDDPDARATLYRLVSEHMEATDSPLAADLLAHWDEALPRFWHVRPRWMIESLKPAGEEAGVMER